jgi:hypothetical protein
MNSEVKDFKHELKLYIEHLSPPETEEQNYVKVTMPEPF